MKQFRSGRFRSRYDRYVFAVLLALEILMSFTFLGYIHIPPISITYAFLPILAAGVLLGPLPATCIGAVFGLCSMYKASAYYVMDGDRIFSPFMSGRPAESFLLSVGVRTLFGLAVGLLFGMAKRSRRPALVFGVIAAFSRKIHSVFIYAAMGLLFPEQGHNLIRALAAPPKASDIVLDILCVLFIEAVWKLYRSDAINRIRSYVDLGSKASRKGGGEDKHFHRLFGVFAAIVLCASVVSVVYFARRTSFMMETHGMELSRQANYDLLHLQTQFLLAILALGVMIWIFFMTVYQYLLYREYLERLDGLTGIMGRSMFLAYCERLFRDNADSRQYGGFLFADLDRFKEINDKQGHPTGDLVLQKVAECLREVFSEYGQAGRMGGDEFAVVLERPVPKSTLETLLNQFQSEIAEILPEKVTCSIGAYYFVYPSEMKRVYKETDRLLYEAKLRGRAQYVIGGEIPKTPLEGRKEESDCGRY